MHMKFKNNRYGLMSMVIVLENISLINIVFMILPQFNENMNIFCDFYFLVFLCLVLTIIN